MGTQYTSLASSSHADGNRSFHRSLTPPVGPGNSKSPTPPSPPMEDDYPPPDHGLPAWMFLFGCFWIECFVWALPFSYGVFQSYYAALDLFKGQGGIAAVGTSTLGLAYFLAPPVLLLMSRYPQSQKSIGTLGLIIMVLSLILASFATKVWHLLMSQGILYGLGATLVYNTYITWLDTWFVKRKGLAYGIFWASMGSCGAVMPFIMDWALPKWGFRRFLRAWAGLTFIVIGLILFFSGPRTGSTLSKGEKPKTPGLGFLKTRLFWMFQIGNIIEGLGYFVPQIYMPSYADTLHFPPLSGIAGVALINAGATIGMTSIGYLVDHIHISIVLLVSAVGAAMAVFLLWGIALSEPLMYVFCITYGIFAGGYAATWTGAATEVKRDNEKAEVAVVMGFLAAGRGLGCIFSGPISEALSENGWGVGTAKGAYGTGFGGIIIFTGVTALLGRFGLFGRLGFMSDRTFKEEQAEEDERRGLLRDHD